MNVVVKTGGLESALAEQFATALPRLPGGKAVAAMRTRALDTFARDGLPHRRIEEWKYTDLRALMREVLPPAAAPDKAALDRAKKALKARRADGTRRLVLVDGAFVPALSDVGRPRGRADHPLARQRAGRRNRA